MPATYQEVPQTNTKIKKLTTDFAENVRLAPRKIDSSFLHGAVNRYIQPKVSQNASFEMNLVFRNGSVCFVEGRSKRSSMPLKRSTETTANEKEDEKFYRFKRFLPSFLLVF